MITYYCPHCHALNKPRNWDESSTSANSPNMRSSPHAQNKDENPPDTNTPDMRSSTVRHHVVNKPRKSGENSSDIYSPKTHYSALNKPRHSDKKSSVCNTSDMKSQKKAVASANLIKRVNDLPSENEIAGTSPLVEESKEKIAKDPANY